MMQDSAIQALHLKIFLPNIKDLDIKDLPCQILKIQYFKTYSRLYQILKIQDLEIYDLAWQILKSQELEIQDFEHSGSNWV